MVQVGLFVFPEFAAMSLSAMTVFEAANLLVPGYYDMTLVSDDGGVVRSSMGVEFNTFPMDDAALDTVIVAGSDHLVTHTPGLVRRLRRSLEISRRVAGMCTGAFALAEAGLLSGRRATTHWFHAPAFRARFPHIPIDSDRLFTVDGPVWTSAGMSAGADMALAMVEQDIGGELAKKIARIMIMERRRSGGQMQFSALLELDAKSDRIQSALTYVRNNLEQVLSVDDLARMSGLSPRQFSRVFHLETGQSPAKAIERMRVEAARLMIEEGSHPIDYIAKITGFNDRERMRRAFISLLGQPPQALRRSARDR